MTDDWHATLWDVQPQMSFTCRSSAAANSSSKQSYVRIKLCCDPIASCAKKKISKPLRLCSATTILQFINMHKFARTWLTPVWEENCSNSNQEVWIQTLTKHSHRHTLHWYSHQLLVAECNTFWDVPFLAHSLSNTVFFFSCLLRHAFIRTVVFGPYLVIDLSLTPCSDSSRSSPVSSACSSLTFVFFCLPSFNST